jgi:hypothetical protein
MDIQYTSIDANIIDEIKNTINKTISDENDKKELVALNVSINNIQIDEKKNNTAKVPMNMYKCDYDIAYANFLEHIKNGDQKHFTDNRTDNSMVLLNDDFIKHPTPKSFKGKLFPHQQTILAAMLELEKKRSITIKGSKLHNVYETSAGRLSEKFGSGKTIIILALLLQCPIPDIFPITQICRFIPGMNTRRRYIKNRVNSCFTIRKTFTPNHIIKPALLFVASSVVRQWRSAVEKFTNMNYLMIDSVFGLRTLYKHIQADSINQFDIIIVKNGNITGKFAFKGFVEDKNKSYSRKIYNIIANITRDKCWSRLILDDYDIIKLPRPTSMMNALFTWFISATDFSVSTNDYSNSEHVNIGDVLKYHTLDLKRLCRNEHINHIFNIRNTEQYTEDSVAIGKPIFLVHRVINKNKKYVQMIGAMAGNKAVEIMEMLNGDAIETAAEHAGIKTDNITDIFKKILQDQYDIYSLSVKTIEFIDSLDIDGFGLLNDPPDGDIYHQKHVYAQKPINYNYPGIKERVLIVRVKCVDDRTESGKAITRVKDNVKEGDCPVCCGSLEEDDVVIVICCDKILCADCAFQGTKLRRVGPSISGKCPMCRAHITLDDMIFMTSNFDLESIITGVYDDKFATQHSDLIKLVEEKVLSKTDVLMLIILGKPTPHAIRKIVRIPGLLVGIKQLPKYPDDKRKVVIFSMFEESLKCIEKTLHENKANYKRLSGTAEALDSVAVEYNESYAGINILVINGEKFSSGLNLQSTTDLVFMHKIIDPNIESQIVGRVQRFGRMYEATVHYILYEEEIPYMRFE